MVGLGQGGVDGMAGMGWRRWQWVCQRMAGAGGGGVRIGLRRMRVGSGALGEQMLKSLYTLALCATEEVLRDVQLQVRAPHAPLPGCTLAPHPPQLTRPPLILTLPCFLSVFHAKAHVFFFILSGLHVRASTRTACMHMLNNATDYDMPLSTLACSIISLSSSTASASNVLFLFHPPPPSPSSLLPPP